MLSYILNFGLTNGKGSSQDAGSLHAEKRKRGGKKRFGDQSSVTSSVAKLFGGQQRRGGNWGRQEVKKGLEKTHSVGPNIRMPRTCVSFPFM
jgi:hypothetical protein